MSITEAAEAFTASYAQAMELSSSSSNHVSAVATALGSHYGRGLISYTYGQVVTNPTSEIATQGIMEHLQRFENSGLGYNIFKERHRIEVVSEGSALCWITWRIRPENGVEGWSWENVYAYRRQAPGQGLVEQKGQEKGTRDGWWEFVISDHEIGNLLQRVPNFLEL